MVDTQSSTPLRILASREDLTELAAINTTILKNGAFVFVTAVGNYYSLRKQSTAAADGLNIVAPATNSPGRWFRLDAGAQPDVATQANWYVDPQNSSGAASDANDGSSPTTPLLTYNELSLRINNVALEQETTVHQISSPALAGDAYWAATVQAGAAQGSLVFQGEAATVVTTQVLTGVVDEDAVAGTQCEITVAGFDWTPFIGQRVRITAGGDVGNVCYIQDTGGTVETARMSTNPVDGLGVPGTFTNGDTVVVEQLTQMADYAAQGRGVWAEQSPTTINDMDFGRLGSPSGTLLDVAGVTFVRSEVTAEQLNTRGDALFLACHLETELDEFYASNLLAFAGCWLECPSITCDGELVFQSTNSSTEQLEIQSGKAQVTGPLAFWDWAANAALVVEFGSVIDMFERVWGTSTELNTFGIRVASGAQALFDTNVNRTPTVAGTVVGKDVEIGSTDLEYATVVPGGYINPTNNAAMVERAI